jgi:hypothetical protein
MRDIFFTLLIIWVLFRIFGKARIVHSSFTNVQNNYPPPEEKKKEGEIKVERISEKKKNPDNNVEDVDYEEIK